MWKTLGYFLCTETSRFGNELHLGSRIELLPILQPSQKGKFKYCDLPFHITVWWLR